MMTNSPADMPRRGKPGATAGRRDRPIGALVAGVLPWGPVTCRRLARTAGVYGCLLALTVALGAVSANPAVQAFAVGLTAPGAGFLVWAGADSPTQMLAVGLSVASFATFLAAVVLWFATGNAILPVILWLGAALAAADGPAFGLSGTPDSQWTEAVTTVPQVAVLALVLVSTVHVVLRLAGGRAPARSSNVYAAPQRGAQPPGKDELSTEDLELMRLIYDRALQPADAFDGFEWVDQFQTAAVRYQINFMAYALAIAQRVHLSAFDGYLRTAQDNLAAKLTDRRVWRYWAWENAWGNLSLQADPIARDNIMLSGFLAAQVTYHRAASARSRNDPAPQFSFAHSPERQWTYAYPQLIDVLVRQYRTARFGLLACEPNWIYPLCNAITATALRGADAIHGTAHWQAIAPRFRECLEAEFTMADGRLVACRSSYTGFAIPPLGGAVMPAFACLFLNALFPDIAEHQWDLVRRTVSIQGAHRAVWPIDIGNYRISRASGYAAIAAAAVEMGDSDIAGQLQDRLDRTYPTQVAAHVAHRPNASLWAHAVELMARCGRAGALHSLVTEPAHDGAAAPFLQAAGYPDVLVARAVEVRGALTLVLYPAERAGLKPITIGGLVPGRRYRLLRHGAHTVTADRNGTAHLNVPMSGRTEIHIAPAG